MRTCSKTGFTTDRSSWLQSKRWQTADPWSIRRSSKRLSRLTLGKKDSPLSALTARELEVLAAIAEGQSNGTIAASLVVTTRAVEKHVNSIFLKLGLGAVPAGSKRVKAALLFLAQQPGSSALATLGVCTRPDPGVRITVEAVPAPL